MLNRVKNYLFDCDGTLVDSELLAMRICCDTLVEEAGALGATVDPFKVMGMFGKTIQQIINAIEQEHNVKYPSDLADRIHQNTVTTLAQEAEPTSGMVRFLELCQAEAKRNEGKLAVVTSSSLDRVLPSLHHSGLKKFFTDEYIYSAHNSLTPSQPKPSPAIYLHACKQLGIEPCEAATWEDSASGVRSARAAGIGRIFGYTGGSHISAVAEEAHTKKLLEAGAERVFQSWQQAEDFFIKGALATTLSQTSQQTLKL
jgi:beta-phosphoglucomutase-like phosphatase (HAD superfamily)